MELLLLAFFSDSVDVFVNDFMLERRVQYQFSFLIFVFVDVGTEDCLFIQARKVFCFSYDILSLDFKVRGQKYHIRYFVDLLLITRLGSFFHFVESIELEPTCPWRRLSKHSR